MGDMLLHAVQFGYTNYRGEFSLRTATPKTIKWTSTEYHPEPQWILSAFDHDKGQMRDFALADCDFQMEGDG